MTALTVGTLLALLALGFVLAPLFRDQRPARRPAPPPPEETPGERAIAALREIEFDRETGKLSDADYATLKSTYTRDALAALRASEATPASAGIPDDEVEAAILHFRALRPVCTTCGPRPEPDALYCSTCGTYLPGSCARCLTPVTEPGARFCIACGTGLAA